MAPAVAGSNPVTHPITPSVSPGSPAHALAAFESALGRRHLATLRFAEVARSLRALSSAYVERRATALAGRRALDGAGKRAAFALYYGPLHFVLVREILSALGVAPRPGLVVDLGCGTGVTGVAVATSSSPCSRVLGVDTHPWALDEARWTCRHFGVDADIRRGHAARVRLPRDTTFAVAAFVANELDAAGRHALLKTLLDAARRDAAVLVVEPVSTRVSPWWPEWTDRFAGAGGRADEWRVHVDLPPGAVALGRAAGLRPDALTARSLLLDPAR